MPVSSRKRIIALFLLALGAQFFIGFPVYSQGNMGITISPLKIDISGNPGETVSREITVTNPNDTPLSVVAEFQDFIVTEKEGDLDIQWVPPDIENPYRMVDWIVITRKPIQIPVGEKTAVPFSIRIPKNASVGGHYAAIFFKADVAGGGGTLGAVPRVGALILLNVGGDVSKSGELLKLTTPRIVNRGPIQFFVDFKNTGTAHYKTKAEISVRGLFGSRTLLASQEKFVYPQLTRKFEVEWGKKWFVGPYFVTAKMADGEGGTYSAKTWFIGFPYKQVLIGISVLYGLWTLWRILKKRFKIVRIRTVK